eukprot:TRINITY_DN15423_c0_g1_i1.p1 TRINITY_DN15423_c0_g1~~TRINITY_DN15423_c0_g1_i1.p1  ORF type:complete len:251 (-),score=53.74 TRINITY_DN15423_c0_g1_i1:198-950(-)
MREREAKETQERLKLQFLERQQRQPPEPEQPVKEAPVSAEKVYYYSEGVRILERDIVGMDFPKPKLEKTETPPEIWEVGEKYSYWEKEGFAILESLSPYLSFHEAVSITLTCRTLYSCNDENSKFWKIQYFGLYGVFEPAVSKDLRWRAELVTKFQRSIYITVLIGYTRNTRTTFNEWVTLHKTKIFVDPVRAQGSRIMSWISSEFSVRGDGNLGTSQCEVRDWKFGKTLKDYRFDKPHLTLRYTIPVTE